MSKIVETFAIQGLQNCVCQWGRGAEPFFLIYFLVHGGYDHLNCKGYCHLLFRPKAGQDALTEFTKKTQDTHAFYSSGHEVSGVLAPSFQSEWASFRALRPCRGAAYPCITGSWVCDEDYTAKDGNAPLLQGPSYCMCKSGAFGQHTVRWRSKQSSLDASPLQIMGACCVLHGCGRVHFWTETVRNSFFRKTVHNLLHSAHKRPRMPCMLGMLSVPSLMESIWDKPPSFPEKCPHLFQKWNFIMEIRKFKKKKSWNVF